MGKKDEAHGQFIKEPGLYERPSLVRYDSCDPFSRHTAISILFNSEFSLASVCFNSIRNNKRMTFLWEKIRIVSVPNLNGSSVSLISFFFKYHYSSFLGLLIVNLKDFKQ